MPEAKYGGWFQGDNGVKKTFVDSVEVSTIRSPSMYANFETIVFDGPKTDEGTSPQYLYHTEAEALAHHDALVEALRKGEPLPDESNGGS